MVLDFLTSEWGHLHDGNESIHRLLPHTFLTDLSPQGGPGHLQSWQESRQIFWCQRNPCASRFCHRHLRRLVPRKLQGTFPFQQCTKPSKMSPRCDISMKNAKGCAPF